MITLGDIFEKPKIELFANSPDTKFYDSCKKREKEIKKTIAIAFNAFNVHVKELGIERTQLAKWKKKWIKLCMTNLGNYLEELINELDKVKIEKHCKHEEKLGGLYMPFMPDLVLVMINSYHGAVETDLHWVTDLTISDSIDISNGSFDFAKLEKYLPKRIDEIKALVKSLETKSSVAAHSTSIHEAIICFNSGHLKASSLLLITIIEGLVRLLGIYLKEKQGLSIDPSDKRKYASLDSLLKKIPWKKDLHINDIRAGLITGNYSMKTGSNEDVTLINLTDRLGFLCRRFKENRNNILHGEETNYATSVNSFLNFSALKEVLLTIEEYSKVYPR